MNHFGYDKTTWLLKTALVLNKPYNKIYDLTLVTLQELCVVCKNESFNKILRNSNFVKVTLFIVNEILDVNPVAFDYVNLYFTD